METEAYPASRNSVILATMLSFAIFWLAGDEAVRKTNNGLNRLQGKPITTATATESGPKLTVQRAVGWAGLFLFLIVMVDIPATAELGAAFAWLLLISMALAFGPDAFGNINKVLGSEASGTAATIPMPPRVA